MNETDGGMMECLILVVTCFWTDLSNLAGRRPNPFTNMCWSKPGWLPEDVVLSAPGWTWLNPPHYVKSCSHGFGAFRFHVPFFFAVLSGVFLVVVTCWVTFAFHGCTGLKVRSRPKSFVFENWRRFMTSGFCMWQTENKDEIGTEHLPVQEEYRETRKL